MTVKNLPSQGLGHPHWHPVLWAMVWLAATALIFIAITGYLFFDRGGW